MLFYLIGRNGGDTLTEGRVEGGGELLLPFFGVIEKRRYMPHSEPIFFLQFPNRRTHLRFIQDINVSLI